MMYKVSWADFLERSKTLAFLSNQIKRKTNMIRELDAFWSLAWNHVVVAGHQSSSTAIFEGWKSGSPIRVITPIQIACANGHRNDR
jgi:hypothetical protein